MNDSYQINADDIMHETIDGEVVIVNLETGAYYAFDGCGEYVWARIEKGGATIAGLATELAAQFGLASDAVTQDIGNFIGQLCDENLVSSCAAQESPAESAGQQFPASYSAPELNKYTDMEALLLADPIHEVKDDGWPNLK